MSINWTAVVVIVGLTLAGALYFTKHVEAAAGVLAVFLPIAAQMRKMVE